MNTLKIKFSDHKTLCCFYTFMNKNSFYGKRIKYLHKRRTEINVLNKYTNVVRTKECKLPPPKLEFSAKHLQM